MMQSTLPGSEEDLIRPEQERELALHTAYLAAEEARRETELLYRLSKAINAAKTYDELLDAVAEIDPDAEVVFLTAWENYDFHRASYFEVVARYCRGNGEDFPPAGIRLDVSAFPLTEWMQNTRIWVFENIQTDPRTDAQTQLTWEAMSTRALLGTILCVGERWIGGLTFHSTVPRQYTSRDKRLVEGIGDIVLAAFERIRLQAETEASRRRAELLARVNAALSQADDEQDILLAVQPLVERFDVAISALAYSKFRSDKRITELETVAMCSGEGNPLPVGSAGPTKFRLAEFPLLQIAYDRPEAPIFVEDVFIDPRPEVRAAQEVVQRLGWPAAIAIPLQTGERWLGTMLFMWKTPQRFTPEMRELFAAVQPGASSVVARRRAYLAEQLRAQELEAVANVSAAAASNLNFDEMLNTVIHLTRINFRQHHICIFLADDAGKTLIGTTEPFQIVSLDDEKSPVAHVGRTRTGLIIEDVLLDTQIFTHSTMLPEMRSEMTIPMFVADRVIGVLDVQSPEAHRFTETDMRVMTTLAGLIAIAIQNARLYRQAQELAVLEERNRLAHDLHDSVSQALYGIALGTRTARTLLSRDPSRLAEPLDYVLTLAEAGLAEMRSLIFELRPGSLENEGLHTAFNKQAAAIRARHNIEVHIEYDDDVRLSLGYEETLFYVAREALHNVVKHAQATEINLRVHRTPTDVILEISDNGRGFDPTQTFPGHLGLQSMEGRAARLGGKLTIESAPGAGTHLRVIFPSPDPGGGAG